jgi:hypothetical protein
MDPGGSYEIFMDPTGSYGILQDPAGSYSSYRILMDPGSDFPPLIRPRVWHWFIFRYSLFNIFQREKQND